MFFKKNKYIIFSVIIILIMALIYIILLSNKKDKPKNQKQKNDQEIKIETKKCSYQLDNFEISYNFKVLDDTIQDATIKELYSYDSLEEYNRWEEYFENDGSFKFNKDKLEIYREYNYSEFTNGQMSSYNDYKDMLEEQKYKCD